MTINPYISLARIKAGLHALEMRPSRGMGQNFLIDADVLEAIVAAAELTPSQLVVEVGPGFGVLTWELIQAAGHVIAVELDKRLAERLYTEFATTPNLQIVQRDILRITPTDLLETSEREPYKVVANLPYAITSPVLRHFLEAEQPPELLVVLVQWEVAQRIAAKPGDMSVLAHALQIYAEPEVVLRIGPDSFHPPPAVDSAILRLRVYKEPLVAHDQVEPLLRVIKAGFLHARKTLSNSLPSGLAAMGHATTREVVLAALKHANVDPQRRAETLSLSEWQAIHSGLRGSA
jgi:16S rRNA (adenine1518-N6/adenine1519-N6)-dimethyltransferase